MAMRFNNPGTTATFTEVLSAPALELIVPTPAPEAMKRIVEGSVLVSVPSVAFDRDWFSIEIFCHGPAVPFALACKVSALMNPEEIVRFVAGLNRSAFAVVGTERDTTRVVLFAFRLSVASK